jgi:glycosyltransferase involved in cell wall biosynthesis
LPPLVSIIIPCFNGARYIPGLAESLRPVLGAQRERFELIFVDDGSTDESADLARKHLSGARLVQQQNCGLSAARNAGVTMAQGEYLQLLDVDDTLEPHKLHVQVTAASSAKADVVYSDWRLVTLEGGKATQTEVFAPAEAPGEMIEALLDGWWAPPVCYLFRRSAYVELGGCDETIKVWEDFDLFLRFALAGRRHIYAPGILASYYRYLDVQSLARRNLGAGALAREAILRRTVAVLRERGKLTIARRKAAAKSLFRVLRTAGISDPAWLQNMKRLIYELDPAFRSTGPAPYRALARIFGLVAAERFAIALRRFRGQRAGIEDSR